MTRPICEALEVPRPGRGILSLLAAGLLLLVTLCCTPIVVSVAFAVAPADTAHCGPQVLVRNKATGQPVRSASVYVRPKTDPSEARSLERSGQVGGDGVIDFTYLKPGTYEVAVFGLSRVRELAEWAPPPPDTSGEMHLGPDRSERPTEGQRFRLVRTWRIRKGDCSDRLVVDVESTPWVVATGLKYIDTTPIWARRSKRSRRP